MKQYLRILVLLAMGLLMAQNPEELLSSGNEKFEAKELDAAEQLYLRALEADPTFAPAMYQLAQVYIRRGEMEKTKDYLNQAIEADLENKEYREEFERLNEINTLMNDGARAMNNGLYEDAFESYRIVLEKFPFFMQAAYSMGLAKYKQREFGEAVTHFRKALDMNPDHENSLAAIANVAKTYYKGGHEAYRRGDLEGAIDAYNQAIEVEPTLYQAIFQIGVIKKKMGNITEAIEAYNRALEIEPNFYKGWFALGLAKHKNGDVEGALEAYGKAVEVNPGYAKAYGSMSEIYINQKEYDKAIEVLSIAIQVDASYSKAYVSLGVVYNEKGNYEEAVSNLEIATGLAPENANAWYRLAKAYNQLKDCENAKRAAHEATDRKKNFGGAWFELGVAEYCAGKGNKTAALNALERARKDRSWRKSAEYEIDKIKNPHKYRD